MRTLICDLGLGDSILLSGAAVVLAQRYGGLRVPCYEQYEQSVRSFYVHHPEIEVYSVRDPQGSTWGVPPLGCFDIQGDPILCGFYTGMGPRNDMSFPQAFYHQLGVDYAYRWDACPIREAAQS